MTDDTFAVQLPLPKPSTKPHPLFERLAAMPEASWVAADQVETVIKRPGITALLVAGDPIRFPEGVDVAVVLPELRSFFAKQYPQFFMGMVTAADEDAVAKKYGATRRPSLIFFRDGLYLDCVGGMLDWDDYLAALAPVLAAAPKRVPSIGIPVVSANSGGSDCH